MKNIFFVLTLLSSICYSQEITYTKGKFYEDGIQISNYDVKQKMQANLPALKKFKQSKSKEAIGGFLLGFGSGLAIADLVVGLSSSKSYPTTATYIGAGFIGVSVSILLGRTKKMQESVELYNKALPVKTKSLGFNVIGNQNGLGLSIQW